MIRLLSRYLPMNLSSNFSLNAALTFSLSLCLLGLVSCASNVPAPVTDLAPPAPAAKAGAAPAPAAAAATGDLKPGFYLVKKGDTLYSIALDHGQGYRDVAAWNSLEDPNRIQIGQQLRVIPPETGGASPVAVTRPVTAAGPIEARPLSGTPGGTSAVTAVAPVSVNSDTLKREPKGGKLPYSEQVLAQMQKADTAPPATVAIVAATAKPAGNVAPSAATPTATAPGDDGGVDWAWPNAAKVTAAFVEGGNKGIDMVARTGDPVLAAGEGKVAYVGTGMRGYGKMVIVKHNVAYLSVYAHNSQILVKEGQTVAKGQKIAEIGSSDSDQPKLHFEIRRQGKPVDPLKYLPAR
jgi:lipoprotein NlpD